MEAVIFDLDDTLCDYRGARESAFASISLRLRQCDIDDAAFLKRYRSLELDLFRSFAAGRISKAQYRSRRFENVLAEFSSAPPELGAELNEIYMSIANEGVQLFADVMETLRELRRLGIVSAILTNGPSDGQRAKIARCRLGEMVDHIFISEDLGLAKPEPACFLAVAGAIRRRPCEIVMVGDSLDDDVRGAQAAGMKGVLLDRINRHPDYPGVKVKGLNEVVELFRGGI